MPFSAQRGSPAGRRAWRLTPLLLALLLAGCVTHNANTEAGRPAKATPVPTATPVTIKAVFVTEADLPGCKLGSDSEFIVNVFARTFDCQKGDRLTETASALASVEKAIPAFDNTWSTLEKATERVRATIASRPVDPATLAVADVTDSFDQLPVDQRKVYCATYGTPTTRIVEFYSAIRMRQVDVEFTSTTTTSPSAGVNCAGPSSARDLMRQLMQVQVSKLQAFAQGNAP